MDSLLSSPPVIRAGDPISTGPDSSRLLNGSSNQASIRVDSQQILAGKTGYLHTTTFTIPKKNNGGVQTQMAIDIVPFASNRYLPQENDMVIGTVLQKNFEFYLVDINSSLGPAMLPALAFQGATKTNKPQYPEGTLLFCRVTKADPNAGRVELSCIDLLDNKKSWNTGEATFKELKGGLVKDFPIAVGRQMLVESSPLGTLLERLGATVQYELVVGYNGRVWVRAESASQVVLVFQAVERLVEMQCKVESVEFIMEQLAPKRK
ncbi:hypothetical protein FGO68_gene2348 [Halteria grandinella]|uniref:K Homology domain-containing protein n=1 Tax=Halteria grandinella TaxID=5974 RepID=A0A8J8NDR9_HALGN|nr:hypothetical protein FGO68_gene2348 [Halteria grandinella]